MITIQKQQKNHLGLNHHVLNSSRSYKVNHSEYCKTWWFCSIGLHVLDSCIYLSPGFYWRPGVYLNTGLESPVFISVILPVLCWY